jgi:hypothetical protein
VVQRGGSSAGAGIRNVLLVVKPCCTPLVVKPGIPCSAHAGAGIGIAMGNAVAAVKGAAAAVVAGHDEDGIAEAFERFVL